MSLISLPIPHFERSAPEQMAPEIPEMSKTANEMSGYITSIGKEHALLKCLLPISDNATSRVWMSQVLSVF